ncbi:MAG: response regulator transcription factor [Saprospiraceae bacterium]|nr:response regulator transcription factor [Saprospiraceae bacterium]
MKLSQSYVLVLAQQSDDLQMLEALLVPLRCPVVVANSVEEVMAEVSQAPPYLVILAGNRQNWSHTLIARLRNHANTSTVTIVALTDVHAPSWQHQEDNPGLDGFLVKPLSIDVLASLVQSAWARQTYCSA